MRTFKSKHQSASIVLKPAKLKQLRKIHMKGEARPLKNRINAKFEYIWNLLQVIYFQNMLTISAPRGKFEKSRARARPRRGADRSYEKPIHF